MPIWTNFEHFYVQNWPKSIGNLNWDDQNGPNFRISHIDTEAVATVAQQYSYTLGPYVKLSGERSGIIFPDAIFLISFSSPCLVDSSSVSLHWLPLLVWKKWLYALTNCKKRNTEDCVKFISLLPAFSALIAHENRTIAGPPSRSMIMMVLTCVDQRLQKMKIFMFQ